MDFKGKNVIVTGGSSGIGGAISKAFLEAGARVYLTYNSNVKAANDIKEQWGDRVETIQMTSPSEENIKDFVNSINQVDCLVNNMGIVHDQLAIFMKKKDFDDVINLNLSTTFLFSKAVLSKMYIKKSGSIVNIGSVSASKAIEGQANYAASKAGIIALTKVLSRESAKRNVRVNAVSPGYIQTSMLDKLSEKQLKEIKASIPLNRMGLGDEVAKAVLFLASDEASYITGSNLLVDGGLSA